MAGTYDIVSVIGLGTGVMNEQHKGQVVTYAVEVCEQLFIPAPFIDWPKQVMALGGLESGHLVTADVIQKK